MRFSAEKASSAVPARPTLPPNQALAAPGRWPIVGERAPAADPSPWCVSIGGLVSRPVTLSLAELTALDAVTWRVDIHCVTRWSRLDVPFTGVPLPVLLDRAVPERSARFVSFRARSPRSHDTSLPIDAAPDVLVAWSADGAPLPTDHGGPVRTVTRDRYFYKSLKWLTHIEVLAEDRPGYWEREAGYHNEADPWREQRYVSSSLDRRDAARVLADRTIERRTLLSLQAAGLDLRALRARDAVLRHADFRGSRLEGADFAKSNLTNARFSGAALAGASLRQADLEGADFRGADLRGVDFRGASLFGATFAVGSADSAERTPPPAPETRMDRDTRFDAAQVTALNPDEARFIATHARIEPA